MTAPSATTAWSWRRIAFVLGLIVAVGALVRLIGLGSDPFWLDEAHSANFTRLGLGELWDWDRPYDRGNPPGYIVLLKIWSQVSRSDTWMRGFSVLVGTATIPVVFLVGLRISGARLGLMAASLLALSGYHVRFSQETRTYALVGLVAAVALLAVTQLLTEPDGDHALRVRGDRPWAQRTAGQGLRRPTTWTDVAWLAYTGSAGVGFLFHNTAAAIPIAANIGVLWWWLRQSPRPPRFARNWIAANIGVLAVWMTWIPGFLDQLGQITRNWWVDAPTILTVAEGTADLFAPSFGYALPWNGQTWGAVALGAAGLVALWFGFRAADRRYRVLLWAMTLTLPVLELVYSLRRPIFLTRTLVWVLVPISLGLALLADSLGGRRRLLAFGALLAISAFGTFAYLTTYEKDAWDEAAAHVAIGLGSRDLVLIQPSNTIVAFDHYFDGYEIEVDEYAAPNRLPDRTSGGSSVTTEDRRLVEQLAEGYDTVWLVLNRIPATESLEPTLDALAASRTTTSVRGVVVIRYEMS